jgi:hypothetical protein
MITFALNCERRSNMSIATDSQPIHTCDAYSFSSEILPLAVLEGAPSVHGVSVPGAVKGLPFILFVKY